MMFSARTRAMGAKRSAQLQGVGRQSLKDMNLVNTPIDEEIRLINSVIQSAKDEGRHPTDVEVQTVNSALTRIREAVTAEKKKGDHWFTKFWKNFGPAILETIKIVCKFLKSED